MCLKKLKDSSPEDNEREDADAGGHRGPLRPRLGTKNCQERDRQTDTGWGVSLGSDLQEERREFQVEG